MLMAIFLAVSGFSQNLLNEGFEGTTFPPANWTQINVSGYSFDRSTDYHNTGSASAFVNWSSAGSENYLITPKLTPEDGDSIVFYYAANDPDYFYNNEFTIELLTSPNDVSTATPLDTIDNVTDAFQRVAISLSDYVGQNIFIAFHYVDAKGTGIAIDDISGVHVAPITCPMPTNLTVANITQTSADFSWTENGTADAWTLYLKKSGTDTYTTYSCTDTTYSVTDLDAGSTYGAYVIANCSNDDSSVNSSTITFQTSCGDITVTEDNIYVENFDANASLGCWTALSTMSYTSWSGTTTTYPTVLADDYYANSSPNYLAMSTYSYYNQNPISVATPRFTNAINTLRVKFYARFGYLLDRLVIGYITDLTDTSTFVAVDTITPTIMYSYAEYESMLNNADTITNAYIVFKYVPYASSETFMIDDVQIDLMPSCIKPTDFTVSNILTDEATISWTENSDATEWTVFTTNTEDGTFDEGTLVTDNPYTITELSPNSTYSVYVVANCSDEDTSDATEILTFTTNCEAIEITDDTIYTENFDADDILHCWTVVKSMSYTDYTGITTFSCK